MRIVTVDTKPKARAELVGAIREAMPAADIVSFGAPGELADYAKEHDCPVVFIEAEMWPITGTDLARELLIIQPKANIIFVSSYDLYQQEALNIGVRFSGFILRPATKAKVAEELANLRNPMGGETLPETVTKGPLTLKVIPTTAYLRGKDILLTQKEFALMLLFIQNEKKEMSVEYIYEQIWGLIMNKEPRALQQHISTLRKKIEGSGYTIKTLRSAGYCFEQE